MKKREGAMEVCKPPSSAGAVPMMKKREGAVEVYKPPPSAGPVPMKKREGAMEVCKPPPSAGPVPMKKREGAVEVCKPPPSAGPVPMKKREGAVEVYKPPRFRYNELAWEKMDYFLVLDFQANHNESYPDVKEIIEFPVLKLNVATLMVEAEFYTYVQPSVQPNITPFITEYTGITQDMVRGKPYLSEVLEKLHEWMISEGLMDGKLNFIFVTCGDWDLKSALPNNCSFLKLAYQDYLKRWINIKACFQAVTDIKGYDMLPMLDYLGMELKGRHGSGIDNSRNIARIMVELMTRNKELREGQVRPRELVRSN